MKTLKNNVNTQSFWDGRYRNYQDKWRIFPYENLYEKYLKNHHYKNIVDYGCGFGEGINYLSMLMNTKFHGVDFSEVAIQKAQELYPQHEFSVIDLNEDFTPIPTDVSIIVQTLEHLSNPLKVVKKLLSVGDVIVSIPNEPEPGGEHYVAFKESDFSKFNPTIIDKSSNIILVMEKV